MHLKYQTRRAHQKNKTKKKIMKKSRQNVCKFESKKNYHHCTMYDLIGFRICADINAIPRLKSGTSKWIYSLQPLINGISKIRFLWKILEKWLKWSILIRSQVFLKFFFCIEVFTQFHKRKFYPSFSNWNGELTN